jgi:hypothetical protein
MSRTDCADCSADTFALGEWYMVKDNVWQQAGMEFGFLCIECLECRLGRTLTASDFTAAPVNNPDRRTKSDRLRDRLTTKLNYHSLK